MRNGGIQIGGRKMEKMSKKYEIRIIGTNSEFASETIRCAQDAEKFARSFYGDDIDLYESAFIMLLNRANRVIGWAKISQGGISSTVVDTKIVCKYALDVLASGVILVHNHPSGNIHPGPEDISLTRKLREALRMFDINLVDSIVIAHEGCFSFADDGQIC